MESDEIKYTTKVYRPNWEILPGHLEPDARPTPKPEIKRPELKPIFGLHVFETYNVHRPKVSILLLGG
jgi:hypothetical protein